MPEDQKTDEKFPIGVFLDSQYEDYGDAYDALIQRIGGEKA